MKRIVICADGTWNVRDQVDSKTGKRRPTNVTKLVRAVRPEAPDASQVVIYHDGVGTGNFLDRITGGAFGDGIERNVQDLYRSILYNYEDGDQLFLFGFSRGAFTVRTLAGFINAVGLLEKGDDYWLPEVYGCYQHGAQPGSEEWIKAFHGVRQTPRTPTVQFIGVWDTVGALGAPGLLGQILNPRKYRYHDVSLNPHILHAAQALAIDERRRPFRPNVWTRPTGWAGSLEQAWFPGVHSDVGGGYTPDGLANEALHWIVERAEGCGLVVDGQFLADYRPCFNSVLHNSMTPLYWMMWPVTRPVGVTDPASEGLHQTAVDRRALPELGYQPKNLADYVKRGAEVVYDTTRVPRGTPC